LPDDFAISFIIYADATIQILPIRQPFSPPPPLSLIVFADTLDFAATRAMPDRAAARRFHADYFSFHFLFVCLSIDCDISPPLFAIDYVSSLLGRCHAADFHSPRYAVFITLSFFRHFDAAILRHADYAIFHADCRFRYAMLIFRFRH
jgi:hypothetical protein